MLNKQGKGKIDYLGYTWNPVKGLCNRCDYCYMKRFYKRFKLDPTIRLDEKTLNCKFPKKPSRIGVVFNHDLFGNWIVDDWIRKVIEVTIKHPQHTFLFLTKDPKRYKFFKFPKNCWLGTTVENQKNELRMLELMESTAPQTKLFVSFEPLLGEIETTLIAHADWIIIGANSNKGAEKPPKEWADKLIEQARGRCIPIWMKDNYKYDKVIKEFPKGLGV